jgi:hypothetical protein
MSRGIKPSGSSRSIGETTPKKKQLGKVRTFLILAIQASCYRSEGMCDCSLPHRVEISVRGEGCDTPSITIASTVPKWYPTM